MPVNDGHPPLIGSDQQQPSASWQHAANAEQQAPARPLTDSGAAAKAADPDVSMTAVAISFFITNLL